MIKIEIDGIIYMPDHERMFLSNNSVLGSWSGDCPNWVIA